MANTQTPPARFPDLEALTAGLRSVLRVGGAPLTILDRRPNRYASVFLSEIVTCQLPDGRELRLFCKGGADRDPGKRHHRGRVAYEADVYRHVLHAARASAPAFYGTYADGHTGETWLVLEYLDRGMPANKAHPREEVIGLAVRWAGHFHALQEARLAAGPALPLHRHDAAFYRHWAREAARCATAWHGRHPWLPDCCWRYEGFIDLLAAQPPTVIHGDYYLDNILLCEGAAYPVDWEWAAVGLGETDLASVTDHWPADRVRHWQEEYGRARWTGGAPAGSERILDLARLTLYLRHLAMAPERFLEGKRGWRSEALRSLAERLGLI
jgi:aminoglycoside phosphotransferase (APT) family kinase protein